MAGSSGYRSALAFNAREFLVLLCCAVALLAVMAVPLLLVLIGKWTGTELDTYKDITAVQTPSELLPSAGVLATDAAEGYAAAVYDVAPSGHATMSAQEFASAEAALDWWTALESGVTNEGIGKRLRRWSEDGTLYLAWTNGRYGMLMFADNDAALSELIRRSDWIDLPGEPGYGVGPRPLTAVLIERYPWLFVALIDLLIILFMWGIFGGGLALATKRPREGTSSVTRQELRSRILQLNSAQSVFVVEDLGGFHLRGRYRFDDAGLSGLLAQAGFTELYQVDMYIKPGRAVLALESRGSVAWEVSAVPPEASYSWSAFRGVVLFDYKWDKEWAFDPQTMRFQEAGEFRFNSDDFKRPLVATVVQSGWTWRPVLFRPLIWSG